MDKLGQEPAFPMVNAEGFPGDLDILTKSSSDCLTVGMSKRLYIAAQIATGLCASELVKSGSFDFAGTEHNKEKSIVKIAYDITDELLKQENNG